ncbi:MAG TPA: class IV adenylate cyclase [Terriglobia bacterium]|nr:class IV adenylate cyclase [Terriglobia bacterium]
MPRDETEIKLKVAHPRAVKLRILELGFVISAPRHLERNFLFDFADMRLRKSSSVIRLRCEGRRSLLTFKGPPVGSASYKIRREIETEVEDGERLREMLEGIGLREVFCYEKFRTTYTPKPGSTTGAGLVVFDQTPIGNFLELEGPKRWIDATARHLGFSRRDYVTASYVSLYLTRCQEEGTKPGSMVFDSGK